MTLTLARLMLLVPDLEEAKTYYTQVLQFCLLEDTQVTPQKRWIVVTPTAQDDSAAVGFVLSLATTPEQQERIGNQTGGKVFAVLHTDSLESYRQHLASHNVIFVRGPEQAAWGTVLVFQDRYGNLWDVVERR